MKNIFINLLVLLGCFSSAYAAKMSCPSTLFVADTKKTVVEQKLDLTVPLTNTGLGSVNETILETAAYKIEQSLIADSTVSGLFYLSTSLLDKSENNPDPNDPNRANYNVVNTILKGSQNDKPNFWGTNFVMLLNTGYQDNSGGYVLLSESTVVKLRKIDPSVSSLIPQLSAGPQLFEIIKKAIQAGYIKNKAVLGISTFGYCSLTP